jgi:N,N'-diacetyllegionaminate synthase
LEELAFQRVINIDGRTIGAGAPIFVIAEIGVNHNGDLDLARRLVRAARDAGADAVKFQSYRTEEFVGSRDLTHTYVSGGRQVVESQFDMFARLQMPDQWHEELFRHARELGVIPMTSVADTVSMGVARTAGVAAYKLASEDLVNLPLLEAVAAGDLPVFLSTGMANEQEVADALEVLARHGHGAVVFLHCVSVYPTPDDEVCLDRMHLLARRTGALVGYSDHSLGPVACIAAAALGACVIEKHFTLDRDLPGPDHALSADPAEMREMVAAIRRVERMRGDGKTSIEPSPTERALRPLFRRSLVASRDLESGRVLGLDDLQLQRCGIEGLRQRDAHLLVGHTLRRAVTASQPILPGDVEP